MATSDAKIRNHKPRRLQLEIDNTDSSSEAFPEVASDDAELLPLKFSGDCDLLGRKCGLCEGDCRIDADCGDGLVCFIRDSDTTTANVPVPGCATNPPAFYKQDFCVDARIYTCRDQEQFVAADGTLRTCGWVKNDGFDGNARCAIYGMECRETCGYCRDGKARGTSQIGVGICQDNEPFWDADAEVSRFCDWITANADGSTAGEEEDGLQAARCETFGAFACRKTCGVCRDENESVDENETDDERADSFLPTPVPSALPTGSPASAVGPSPSDAPSVLPNDASIVRSNPPVESAGPATGREVPDETGDKATGSAGIIEDAVSGSDREGSRGSDATDDLSDVVEATTAEETDASGAMPDRFRTPRAGLGVLVGVVVAVVANL